MSQYNKLSDFQYARFQLLAMHLHFELFQSGGIHSLILIVKLMGKHWDDTIRQQVFVCNVYSGFPCYLENLDFCHFGKCLEFAQNCEKPEILTQNLEKTCTMSI